MLAYLSWLVERGVFKRIYRSYHPVGHTHNECDQVASRIAIATARANIGCRCDLVKVLQGCYTPKPHVETIDNVVALNTQLIQRQMTTTDTLNQALFRRQKA